MLMKKKKQKTVLWAMEFINSIKSNTFVPNNLANGIIFVTFATQNQYCYEII